MYPLIVIALILLFFVVWLLAPRVALTVAVLFALNCSGYITIKQNGQLDGITNLAMMVALTGGYLE
jgi:hypothetical protein